MSTHSPIAEPLCSLANFSESEKAILADHLKDWNGIIADEGVDRLLARLETANDADPVLRKYGSRIDYEQAQRETPQYSLQEEGED